MRQMAFVRGVILRRTSSTSGCQSFDSSVEGLDEVRRRLEAVRDGVPDVELQDLVALLLQFAGGSDDVADGVLDAEGALGSRQDASLLLHQGHGPGDGTGPFTLAFPGLPA